MGIGDIFSGIASAIGSFCTAIGGSLGMGLTAILTALNPILGLVTAAIPLVIKIIELLAPKEIDPKDIESGKLAVMAEQCPDIKPENFDSISDYIKALGENVDMEKVDEKMRTLSDEETQAYKLCSAVMVGPLIAEKLNVKDSDIDLGFLAKVNVLDMGTEKTVSFIKDLDAADVSTSDMSKYLDGSLSGEDLENKSEGIKTALEKLDPMLKTDDQKEAFSITGQIRLQPKPQSKIKRKDRYVSV